MKYLVTVKCDGKPNYSIIVEADRPGLAQSSAMLSYPHSLRGELVKYDVVPVDDKIQARYTAIRMQMLMHFSDLLAANFPNVESGDFPPGDQFILEQAIETAVTQWLATNLTGARS